MDLLLDHALAHPAERQHGVVARRQLLALGLSPETIGRRVRARRGVVVLRGVYAVGHAALTPDGRRKAAALAARAPLSHRSAGSLLGIRPWNGSFHELTRPGPGGRHDRRRAGLVIHRSRVLVGDEITEVRGIPVTSFPQTLIDLAGRLKPDHLRRVVERADQLELFDLAAVEQALARHRGRSGVVAVRSL
jgi:hypothetical protein